MHLRHQYPFPAVFYSIRVLLHGFDVCPRPPFYRPGMLPLDFAAILIALRSWLHSD